MPSPTVLDTVQKDGTILRTITIVQTQTFTKDQYSAMINGIQSDITNKNALINNMQAVVATIPTPAPTPSPTPVTPPTPN